MNKCVVTVVTEDRILLAGGIHQERIEFNLRVASLLGQVPKFVATTSVVTRTNADGSAGRILTTTILFF